MIFKVKALKVINCTPNFPAYHCKSMSKTYPFFLYKNFKALDGSVIAVQHKHGQCSELCSSIPAIAAVHHYRGFTRFNFIRNSYCSSKKHLK